MTTPIATICHEPDPGLADHLESLEATLESQLLNLPTARLDDVAAAHRASIERNLKEVRTARRCLTDGRYGSCLRCADPISVGRLAVRPWATRCTRCAERPEW
ncbi:MAG: TraR/DksA C4-type zinc finger protein [Marmoricola sp.]